MDLICTELTKYYNFLDLMDFECLVNFHAASNSAVESVTRYEWSTDRSEIQMSFSFYVVWVTQLNDNKLISMRMRLLLCKSYE